MPITYTQQEIHVKLWNLETSEWDTLTAIAAQIASNGLAYHPSIRLDQQTQDRQIGPDFTITHVASGHRFYGAGRHLLRTPQQCERLICLVDRVFDWTSDAKTISAHSSNLIPTIRAIVKYVLKERVRAGGATIPPKE